MNIASNAVKYNKENGRIKICVTEKEIDCCNTYVEFDCADTGTGMSEEYSAHILSLFLRKIQAQEPNLAEADLEWLL